jgi:glycosyltransferase involved in cell wall biosynthesis
MFNVPCYFFMHTDWLDFIRHNTDLNQHERDRVRRLLRFFYGQFSGVFVLNREHQQWLTGHEMQLEQERVLMTAHHVEQPVVRLARMSKRDLLEGVDEDTPVVMYAGRLSREKGLDELPGIMRRVNQAIPAAKLVICGTGPYQEELQQSMPQAVFTGWIDKHRLRQLYAGLDLMVFPSRFDTFGNVVLEAFSNGMPVVAYDCKGPRDIIKHGVNGYLADSPEQIGQMIIDHFENRARQAKMRENALRRSRDYNARVILDKFVEDLGLAVPREPLDRRSVA